MKLKSTVLLALLFSFLLIHSAESKEISNGAKVQVNFIPSEDLAIFNLEELGAITPSEFVNISPKQIQSRTGKKLKFKERMVLKMVQSGAKRQLKKDGALNFEDLSYDFSLGGFLLGFILGLLGVLIAALGFPKNVLKSALLGLVIWVGLLLLGLVLI